MLMGKTYRKNNAGSQSESYRASSHRGFAKEKKQYTRGQVRKHNKTCDDTDIKSIKSIKSSSNLMKDHFASAYANPMSNLNYTPYQMLEGHLYFHEKWKKEDGDILNTIDTRIEKFKADNIKDRNRKTEICESTRYLNATKKQILRRGESKMFTKNFHINEKQY